MSKGPLTLSAGLIALVMYALGVGEIPLLIAGGALVMLIQNRSRLRWRGSAPAAIWLGGFLNPILPAAAAPFSYAQLFWSFFKIGAVLYGSGYVLFAYLKGGLVDQYGWLSQQELLDAGMVTEEEARLLPAKNLVTRALGASSDIEPEIQDVDVRPGDMLMLCSDGLTEMVGTYEIAGLLSIGEDDTHETARRLIDLANESGGRDNISVILIRVVAAKGLADE